MMTVKEVRKKVREIRLLAKVDAEVAHSKEDDLYLEILRSIAAGKCESPRDCAVAALKTVKIKFSRHYAYG